MALYPALWASLWLISSFTQVMSCLLAAQLPFSWGRSTAETPLATVSRSASSCPRGWAGEKGVKGEEFGSAKNSGRATSAVLPLSETPSTPVRGLHLRASCASSRRAWIRGGEPRGHGEGRALSMSSFPACLGGSP